VLLIYGSFKHRSEAIAKVKLLPQYFLRHVDFIQDTYAPILEFITLPAKETDLFDSKRDHFVAEVQKLGLQLSEDSQEFLEEEFFFTKLSTFMKLLQEYTLFPSLEKFFLVQKKIQTLKIRFFLFQHQKEWRVLF
jgi:hypothetical protein